MRSAQEAGAGVEPAVGLELRILVEGARPDRGAAAHEQIGVAQLAAGLFEHVEQGAREHAVSGRFLGQLTAFARRQQDVPGRGHEQRLLRRRGGGSNARPGSSRADARW